MACLNAGIDSIDCDMDMVSCEEPLTAGRLLTGQLRPAIAHLSIREQKVLREEGDRNLRRDRYLVLFQELAALEIAQMTDMSVRNG